MGSKLRLALLISGGGTTAEAIIRACNSGRLNIDPVCVIASSYDAGGITKALANGIPAENLFYCRREDFESREDFGEKLIAICEGCGVDLIGQYGWMKLTPANVIEAYEGRMINQHPGPLDIGRPDFGGQGMFGRRVHCARLFFVRRTKREFWTEVTAQRVAVEYDKGAVLRALRVSIEPDDDPISLQERALGFEHKVQIEALHDFATGQVTEQTRDEPLVRPDELEILSQAKRIAALLFPKG